MVNLWTSGHNEVEGVYASDIVVENSSYYKPCDSSEGRIMWEAEDGLFTKFEVTELQSFTPREPPSVDLDWKTDNCGFEPPSIDCSSFKEEAIGVSIVRTNVNTGEVLFEENIGSCWGSTSWFD